MPYLDILTAQLTDIFRIGLLLALVYTAWRNRAATGWALPLLAGLVFVAVIIPSTMQSQSSEPLWLLVGVGIVANLILLAVVMAVLALVQRFRK